MSVRPVSHRVGSVVVLAVFVLLGPSSLVAAERFEGRYYRGAGDVAYLQLLDAARRMFEPDPEFQNLPMLYSPAWNGLVEGPTWGAWWIQNSYGPTYCALPFWQEPYTTFLQNSQDLWFNQMGDGQRKSSHDWVAPDGCLCDAAAPGWFMPKQGDGRIKIHDWGMEFSAAGLVMQAELLLISRDAKALAHYLPKLERVANFIETRRDPKNNLFLAGAAGNLLAPSYAGYKKPDGTYGMAYLAGLSITYIAGLDRLIELEKLAGNADKVKLYSERRDLARKGLPLLTTDEGYFIKYLDPDGTRHGVYGAAKHGYFEAVANHDAICFRVADDAQSRKIYAKIAAIPGLRPVDLIITNCPSLDDMYEQPRGLWGFGTWVNGGHWTTCEARMIMAYYRLGQYADARRAMEKILDYFHRFRTDNPLVKFGADVYQPNEPINCVYDTWGAPAAFVRGLFEYLYRADALTVLPHIPPGIVELEQRFPIRFGPKRLWLATVGSGPITAVTLNGRPWKTFDAQSVSLSFAETPDDAIVQIVLGGATPRAMEPVRLGEAVAPVAPGEVLAKASRLFPVISANQLPLRIGANTGHDAGNHFVGELARPLVFSRALSSEEIAALVRDPAALAKDPALVGDWDFAARQGNTFPNAAVQQMPAKIVGQVTTVDSPHGKAIRLDGQGYLEVAHDSRLDITGGLTLAVWLRPGDLAPTGGRILDKCRVGTNNGYMIDLFPGRSLRFIIERGSMGTGLPAKQEWIHVAATAAPDGTQALYVDGKRVAQQKHDAPPELVSLEARAARLRRFHAQLVAAGLADTYEAAHARLVVRYVAVSLARFAMLAEGKLKRLPEASQYAADKSYVLTAVRLGEGLDRVLQGYQKAEDAQNKRIYQMWEATKTPAK